MRESVVEIPEGSGNRYRYQYNPDVGATEYLGPVGESPPLAEAEFNVLMKARTGRDIYNTTIREGQGKWVPNFKPDGRQLYETRLTVLALEPWGGREPSDILALVQRAGYTPDDFSITTTNGEWEFIVKEWKVRKF
jgi:hypothetical protein